jgi:5-methylcytosine-specific restriction protein A
MPKLHPLRSLPFLVRTFDTRTTKLPPKVKDPTYNTPQFRQWRAMVIARAGGRCEAMDRGHRCSKAWPEHRLYADHVIELKDGGQPFDINNGQALCASHHEIKTISNRVRRFRD